MRKVSKFVVSVLVILAPLWILGFLPNESLAQKVTFKLGHTQNPGTAIDKATLKLAERVAELSKGTMEIKVFGAMSLGSEREEIEQVQLGGIDFGIFSNDYLSNVSPTVGVVALPYILRDIEHVHKVWNAPVGKEVKENLLKKGLRSLGTYDYSFRNTITRTKPIKALPDFKGVKIRVMENPTVIKTWTLLGANPVPMPWNEVYSAMQTKVIDAMEAPPESMVSIKVNEVGKYLTMTQHQYTGSHIIMGEKSWQKLNAEQKKILQQAAIENEKFQREVALNQNKEFLEKLKGGGIEIYEIDKTVLQKIVRPVYDDFTKSIGGGNLIDRILAVK
jgi:tripartite ATP-independent transporter DctP family solute receptor